MTFENLNALIVLGSVAQTGKTILRSANGLPQATHTTVLVMSPESEEAEGYAGTAQ
jgi:hypothetical protein